MTQRNLARLEPALARELDRVGADRTTGAGRLAQRALNALARTSARWKRVEPSDLHLRARAVGSRLRRVQPAMGTFGEWATEWTHLARTPGDARLARAVDRWVRRWNRQLGAERRGLVLTFRKLFPGGARVISLSLSDTLLAGLSGLPSGRRPREVLVLESLPGGEGRRAVRDLRRHGLDARVVPDRSAATAVRGVDLVLLGADAVYADGTLVHKVGTRRLVRAAQRSGVPVIVVAGRSKWVRRRRPPRRLPRLFDRTPGSDITEFWTESGRVVRGPSPPATSP